MCVLMFESKNWECNQGYFIFRNFGCLDFSRIYDDSLNRFISDPSIDLIQLMANLTA